LGSATRLIAIYFSHFCALVIIVTMLGAIRLVRSVRPLHGPAVLSQVLALSWLALLVIVTYMVPPMGIWAIGLVVPLFADNHFHAWMSERLGAEALMRNTMEVLRKVGFMKYVAMASIPHLLHGSIGMALVTVSGGRNSWEQALGMGMLMSAPMGVASHALTARRLMRSGGAATTG
jgi:hypothetical protein